MQESKWKDHRKGASEPDPKAKIEEAGPSGGEDRLRILTFISFLDMHKLTDAQVHSRRGGNIDLCRVYSQRLAV